MIGDSDVERHVKARHARHAGQRGMDRIEGGQRLRLVQRRQVRQGLEALPHPCIHHRRGTKQRSPAHDPVPDGIHVVDEEIASLSIPASAPVGRRQIVGVHNAITGVEQAQFEATRPRVDDKDPQDCHAQSLISGASSPSSRV